MLHCEAAWWSMEGWTELSLGSAEKQAIIKKKHIWHMSVLRVSTNLLNHPANTSNDSPSFPGSLSLGNQIPQHLACNLHLQNHYPLTKRNKELVSKTNWEFCKERKEFSDLRSLENIWYRLLNGYRNQRFQMFTCYCIHQITFSHRNSFKYLISTTKLI